MEPFELTGSEGLDMAALRRAQLAMKLHVPALKASVVRGRTSREAEIDETYAAVGVWSKLTSEKAMLADPLCQKFEDVVSTSRILSGSDLLQFRGRCDTKILTALEMGPNPDLDQIKEGRFHKARQKVLYLSASVQGCLRELMYWKGKGTPYIQHFRLPAGWHCQTVY